MRQLQFLPAELGTSPARYIEQLRIEAARQLLEDSRDNLEEIASACGFSSAELMRRAFLRLIGITPNEYRERFRSGRVRSDRRFSLAPLPQGLEKRLSIESEIEQSRTEYFGRSFFGPKTRLRAIDVRQPDSTINPGFRGVQFGQSAVLSPASVEAGASRARPALQYSSTLAARIRGSGSTELAEVPARSSFSAHLLTALSASESGARSALLGVCHSALRFIFASPPSSPPNLLGFINILFLIRTEFLL